MDDVKIDPEHILALLNRLNGTGSDDEWLAANELRTLGAALPRLLLDHYRASRGWKARSSCVYHAARFALESEDAIALGLEAIRDKSKVVRYRGALLLANSQRKEALSFLRAALTHLGDGPGANDLLAAIDAIESGNPNYFIDREHTGKIKLTIS